MSDNSFNEHESDRTVVVPTPGRRRAAAPVPPAVAPPEAAAALDIEALAGFGASALAVAAMPLLQLLSRLGNTVAQPDGETLRERAIQELRRFEKRARDTGIAMDQLRPAHYALCASLDDAVLNTPWGSAGPWGRQPLVASLHGGTPGDGRFFDLLGQMRAAPTKFMPVIELMYLCLSLGFMGRYRAIPGGVAEVERLRADVYTTIAPARPNAAAPLAPHWAGVAAPYRARRARFPLWVAASVALALVGGMFLAVSLGLSAASDDLYARMLAAAPAHMPRITRDAIVHPPPPPPAAEPDTLDRLGAALRTEIAQRQVILTGSTRTPVVRIADKTLFPVANATLAPAAVALLERIGALLAHEAGAIRVVAYTDSRPVRTVQFPSNFELSAARAAVVRAALLPAAGDSGRIVAEGRAGADPIASNASAPGREENRRVEIILNRP